MYGISIEETGGIEKMQYKQLPDHNLEFAEVKIRHTAIGVNYIDVDYRKGVYRTSLPSVLGIEAAGVVEEIAPGAEGFAVGDRVAYGTATTLLGAYSTYRNMPSEYLIKIPDHIPDEIAATVMVQGLFAQTLLRRVYMVHQGQSVLIHAAAGGVGTYLTQWAKYLGCTVIGTVGSDEKKEWALENGCCHVVNYNTEDFASIAREVTNGSGVAVVFDGVGHDTFEKSLKCIMPFGLMVSYGQSSGRVAPVDVMDLARGNIFLTRPTLNVYKHDYNEMVMGAMEVFEGVNVGALMPRIIHQVPLQEAAEAHRLLESRESKGSIILIP